ncbi:LysR family transcriptional regulator [Pandoraea terrigena]|uniref:LysR family transcriptional regulator n=1 Tax=Pandoraea terrigena TaxID=2508292 RepID=A0A5E4XZ86_9BURK|nr:LysR family transcriptional regulator [Pandoraea terrigena]VVE41422.1 LysR family transcriptional regulator [Pandoraea terrigena]
MTAPDLNLLIALDALLAEVSVARAARRLGLSASAMSRTLSRLRDTTGDPLLVRAGRRMVLTPHAEQLRARSQDALDEARTLLTPATASPDFATLRRTFTLRANDGFVEAFGASLIAALTQVAPFASLRFLPKTEKTAAPLRNAQVDLEIGVLGDVGEASNMGPEIRVQTLFRDRFVGAVRSGHPLEAHGAPDAERYVAFGHVVASRHGTGEGPIDAALDALGLRRDIVAVVPSFPAALSVAQASDLIALVPASLMTQRAARRASTASASFHVFDLPVATEQIAVSLMWHPRMEADPVHRWLRQHVLSVCRAADATLR